MLVTSAGSRIRILDGSDVVYKFTGMLKLVSPYEIANKLCLYNKTKSCNGLVFMAP